MRKLLTILILAAVSYAGYVRYHALASMPEQTESAPRAQLGDEASGTQVEGSGVVARVLSDDNDGSRHQRFILRLASGQTILVAHNIDLAPRVSDLSEGDTVEYKGEFEWNPKGGVVHWTHRDPSGRHAAGWLKHNGQVFQ
jgi:hypothetical protein